jgi:UDP-glucose 4-epimerase
MGTQHALLRRIVRGRRDRHGDRHAADRRLSTASPRTHENNVIGTMNILAACGGPDSPVRKVVFKSSAHFYGCERDDPAFFTEEMRRPYAPRTPIERDIVEAERAVSAYAQRSPQATVSILRFANGLGHELDTSHTRLLSGPVVPAILGFDPRYQFIGEDDIAGVLEHATRHDLPGAYNAAGDGVLALSEVASLLGKPLAPILPPWGSDLAAAALRRLGLRIPAEMLPQLRYGRGLDNRRLKAAGYTFRATTREAVQAFAEHLRVRDLRPATGETYRYEREVEEFLRWSPAVRKEDRLGLGRLSRDQLGELGRALDAMPHPAEASEQRRITAPEP